VATLVLHFKNKKVYVSRSLRNCSCLLSHASKPAVLGGVTGPARGGGAVCGGGTAAACGGGVRLLWLFTAAVLRLRLSAGLLAAGLRLLRLFAAAGLRLRLSAGLRLLWLFAAAGLRLRLSAGLRLRLSAGLRLLAAGLRLYAAAPAGLRRRLLLLLAADPQPSSCGIVGLNQPIGESGSGGRVGWGCAVGGG